MLVLDHWYPAGPSSSITADAPFGFEVWDRKLVAFRDGDGIAHVLRDRCCHRGVPLSLGRITDGSLACGYHGWEYDGEGTVVHVPSTDKPGPKGACVPALPTVEADHYVWVWIAGEHDTPTHEPALIGVADHGWMQYSGVWQTPVMPAVENQLDGAHTPFSHPGIYPGHRSEPGVRPPLRSSEMDLRWNNGGVESFGPPADRDTIPHWEALIYWTRFELPYRNYVFLTAQRTFAIYLWVPLTPTSCRLEFMTRVVLPDGSPRPRDAGTTPLEQEIELLAQDRVLLEGAADRNRDDPNERSVPTDAPQLLARKLVELTLGGKDVEAAGITERRHVIPLIA